MPRRNFSSNGNGSHPPDPSGALTTTESVAVFMERDPAAYAKCVQFLEEGHSPKAASVLCQIPLATARKVRDLLGEVAVHAGIRRVARNLVEASQGMSERLVNEFEEIPIHILPNALSVIIDRASLLSGNPSAIIEHRNVPTPEDVMKMFESLPQAKTVDITEEQSKQPTPHPLYSAARPQRKLK